MKSKGVTLWLFLGCLLVFLMVIIGGITRLTGSGLSIVEWNLISGTLPPLTHDAWEVAFEKYKQFPEYNKLNTTMDLHSFKFIFFWEYLHRLLGRVIGLVFIIPFFVFYFQKKIDGPLLKKLLVILVLGALQGFVGWFMVKSGLVDRPHVSHYRLAVHFLMACLLISAIFITALGTMKMPRFLVSKKINTLGVVIISLIVLQFLYGAFTAGLKAGFFYTTFPTMNGQWIPNGILDMNPVLMNFLDNGITVQFMHRLIGSLLFVTVIGAAVYVYRSSSNLVVKRNFIVLSGSIILQVTLGVITLVNRTPVTLGVLHQAMAIIVLLIAVFMVYSMRKEPA